MTRVKICGIRRMLDAQLAVKYGADAIGILVGQQHASSDFIEPAAAAEIIASLPPFVTPVLVTHISDAEEVIELVRRCRPQAVQIHSGMPPEGVARVRAARPALKIIKSLHVLDASCADEARPYAPHVDAFLLDSANPATGQVGGTGMTHDWNLSRQFARVSSRPAILAGGLNPENVREAIRVVSPFGVDVNSGVKGADGFKDEAKLKAFIERARA